MRIVSPTPRQINTPTLTTGTKLNGLDRCTVRVRRAFNRAVGSKTRRRLLEKLERIAELRLRIAAAARQGEAA